MGPVSLGYMSYFRLVRLACFSEILAGLGGSFGCTSDWRSGSRGFEPRRGRQHSFVEIEICPANLKLLTFANSVLLSIAELENLSANEYANYCWHFHIY